VALQDCVGQPRDLVQVGDGRQEYEFVGAELLEFRNPLRDGVDTAGCTRCDERGDFVPGGAVVVVDVRARLFDVSDPRVGECDEAWRAGPAGLGPCWLERRGRRGRRGCASGEDSARERSGSKIDQSLFIAGPRYID
jgi:hypothetical protein